MYFILWVTSCTSATSYHWIPCYCLMSPVTVVNTIVTNQLVATYSEVADLHVVEYCGDANWKCYIWLGTP